LLPFPFFSFLLLFFEWLFDDVKLLSVSQIKTMVKRQTGDFLRH